LEMLMFLSFFGPTSTRRRNSMSAAAVALLIGIAGAPQTSRASDVAYAEAFSPGRGATQLVVRTIQSAKRQIHMAVYTFTSYDIADALVAAAKHGVEVSVVADYGENSNNRFIQQLAQNGVHVELDGNYAIMHNKFMVVDGAIVQLGSFNYTQAAEKRNAENVLVLVEPKIAAGYEAEWERMWNESRGTN